MHASDSTEYQKFSVEKPSAPPPQYDQPASGIPVSSINQSYDSHQPRSQIPVHSKPMVDWSTGLCGCFEDVPNCCVTFWCPCITFGQIAEIVDKGSSSCGTTGGLYALIAWITGCACIYSCFYRSKMRQQYHLHEAPCGDCLVHFCCEGCALCQEYRELKNRGFDMSIGWNGNVENQNRGVITAPVVEGGMSK